MDAERFGRMVWSSGVKIGLFSPYESYQSIQHISLLQGGEGGGFESTSRTFKERQGESRHANLLDEGMGLRNPQSRKSLCPWPMPLVYTNGHVSSVFLMMITVLFLFLSLSLLRKLLLSSA